MTIPASSDISLLDGSDSRPIHFMGIAGAGMSALAELLARRGMTVTGCDANAAPSTATLRAYGIAVYDGHDAAHVAEARAVVVTSAVPRDHPELKAARAAKIPVLRRAEALAEAVRGGTVLAIAGTHGKTTTTVMTTDALAAAGLDPTGIAGGRVTAWSGNLWWGESRTFVVEADEYDRSFLALTPTIAAVTSVEADHLDVYHDIGEIQRAFEQFIQPARTIVVCADDPIAASLALPKAAELIGYGIRSPAARLRATGVHVTTRGSAFAVEHDGARIGEIRLQVHGEHNVLNALAAIGCGLAAGATLEALRPGLEAFAGVERRFQRIGAVAGVTIVDDYAHHPTEITATLATTRAAFPGARIVAAFQPHLFTRTRDFAAAFAESLAAADAVFLTGIYPAREQAIPGVTSALVADALARTSRKPEWTGEREALAGALAEFVRPGDVVLAIGAGDISLTAYELRDLLARR